MLLDINIFVVDLKAYNEGHLHGDWIDATKDLVLLHFIFT